MQVSCQTANDEFLKPKEQQIDISYCHFNLANTAPNTLYDLGKNNKGKLQVKIIRNKMPDKNACKRLAIKVQVGTQVLILWVTTTL